MSARTTSDTGEITMHPVVRRQLMQARVAELNTGAQRGALATDARRAHRKLRHQAGHSLAGLPTRGWGVLHVSTAWRWTS
jgi:hypothetical protein